MLQAHVTRLIPDNEAVNVSELITLAKASEISGITQDSLRVFVRRGRIKAIKIGASWMTTSAALEEYLNTPRRKGRPSRNDKK